LRTVTTLALCDVGHICFIRITSLTCTMNWLWIIYGQVLPVLNTAILQLQYCSGRAVKS